MSGSSGPAQTNVTQTTSNLPDYAQPYWENLVDRAQALSYQPYTPYQDQRVADFTPGQTQAQSNILNLQTPTQFGAATGLAGAAGLGSLMSSGYTPTQFQADRVVAPPVASANPSGGL